MHVRSARLSSLQFARWLRLSVWWVARLLSCRTQRRPSRPSTPASCLQATTSYCTYLYLHICRGAGSHPLERVILCQRTTRPCRSPARDMHTTFVDIGISIDVSATIDQSVSLVIDISIGLHDTAGSNSPRPKERYRGRQPASRVDPCMLVFVPRSTFSCAAL